MKPENISTNDFESSLVTFVVWVAITALTLPIDHVLVILLMCAIFFFSVPACDLKEAGWKRPGVFTHHPGYTVRNA